MHCTLVLVPSVTISIPCHVVDGHAKSGDPPARADACLGYRPIAASGSPNRPVAYGLRVFADGTAAADGPSVRGTISLSTRVRSRWKPFSED